MSQYKLKSRTVKTILDYFLFSWWLWLVHLCSSLSPLPPVLVSKPTITVLGEVVLGRSFQIECYSDTGSFPITYSLKRNYTKPNYIVVSRAFQKAIFNASIMSEKEIHEFRCEAQNNGINPALTSNAPHATVTGELPVTFNPENTAK